MSKVTKAYMGIVLVIIIWGLSPLMALKLLDYFSPCAKVFIENIFITVFFFISCRQSLKHLDLKNLKYPLFSGLFYGMALVLQQLGLPYTTPTKFSFFENIDCIIVPVVTYILTKKLPKKLTVAAALICITGIYVLNTTASDIFDFRFGLGEILCAAAGVLYGINFTLSGLYVLKTGAAAFLFIGRIVTIFISLVSVVAFNFIKINGVPIDKIVLPNTVLPYVFLFCTTIMVGGIGWLTRTASMKYVDPSIVAVIMPFASVITGTLSVLLGKDELSFNLIAGGILIICAIIISGLSSVSRENKPKKLKYGNKTA